MLKVYDPRFMFNVRKTIKQIWAPEFEARAAEFRQTNPIPGEFDDLPYVCELEKPEGLENYAFLQLEARSHFASEVKAYSQLRSLRGNGVPRFLGHGTLTSATLQTDSKPRYITPSLLLLEFSSDSVTVRDADPARLPL